MRFEQISTDKQNDHMNLIEPAVNYLEDLRTTRSYIAAQRYADYLAACRSARKKVHLKNQPNPDACSICTHKFLKLDSVFLCGLSACGSLFHQGCCKDDSRTDRVMYCGPDCKKEDEGTFNPPSRSASAPVSSAAAAAGEAAGLSLSAGQIGDK